MTFSPLSDMIRTLTTKRGIAILAGFVGFSALLLTLVSTFVNPEEVFAAFGSDCFGCRQSEGGSASGFGGFGGGGGGGELGTGRGGGGAMEPPQCTLDLTKDAIAWTTRNATIIDIVPLTNSPAVPGRSAISDPAPGTVVFSGDFGAFKAANASRFQQDATEHGGVTLGDASFKADKATADRLCQIVHPGTESAGFGSDTFSSPKNNTIAIWDGSAWSVVPAKGNDPHLRFQFNCRVPGFPQSPFDLNGSKNFVPPLPVGTHTYKLTAQGAGEEKICQATVVVPPPPTPSPAPGCVQVLKETFTPSGAALTPVPQFTFKLDGDAQTVTTDSSGNARFNNVTPGTHTVTEVPQSGWNLLSVTPSSGTVQVSEGPSCAAVVFKNQQVLPPPPPPGAGCINVVKETFDPSGNPLTPVAQFTFTLDGTSQTVTTDANGRATLTNIAPGIHTVSEVNPGSSWQLLSVTPSDGQVNVPSGSQCATVLFKNKQVVPSQPNQPICALSVDRPSIKPGESIKISWTSSNVTSGEINGNVGPVSPVSGGTIADIFPSDSTQYTGTFTGPDGNATCSVSVIVERGGGGGGGGLNQPTVKLLKSPSEQPLAFVSLTQIPYTGFEAGPLLTALFWLAVALWSAGIAYLIVGKRSMRFVVSQLWPGIVSSPHVQGEKNGMPYDAISDRYAEYASLPAEIAHDDMAAPMTRRAIVPSVIAAPGIAAPQETSVKEILESHAHQSGILLSPEALEEASRLSDDPSETIRIFGEIVNEAVKTLPREDGWILLSSDRLFSIVSAVGNPQSEQAQKSADSDIGIYPSPETLTDSAIEQMIGAILEKRRDVAFSLLRELEGADVNALSVVMETVRTIDRLYQARAKGDSFENLALREKAEGVSAEQLRRIIDIFSSALDTTYTLPYTGLKIALAQAFDLG